MRGPPLCWFPQQPGYITANQDCQIHERSSLTSSAFRNRTMGRLILLLGGKLHTHPDFFILAHGEASTERDEV